ncbi:FMN-dependent NADH-azoreductase [Paraburkholderia sp. UCT31]|uniref:FMN-dependent NADH-azoreductase n=1 Tax=Paraburkholderia sp. UCT31 TaxID=2615209 RepID=UPI001655C761|nr:NAD(P)H-dependent oxidoreductase [Paraburkholderia sp. UCT31]MBC8741872.1 FMN-dependent NADH-azoreductase [Paraburkholderia sp. UCT31]
MHKVLFVNGSVRGDQSASHGLAKHLKQVMTAAGAVSIKELNLAKMRLPVLDGELLGAFFGQPETLTLSQKERLATSDRLIDELFTAETVVISAGMYNFSVSAELRTYIDHICRAGRTFRYTANGPEGLVKGKKAILVLSSGGVYSEGPAASMDFFSGYLTTVLGFIGITDVTVVRAEGLALGEEVAAKALSAARDSLTKLAA